MNNDPQKTNAPTIPDIIQGYPVLNSFIRQGLGYAAASITLAIVGFLDAKGFHSSLVVSWLPYLITGALVAVAAFAWSLIASKQKTLAMVEHVLEAAQSGQVPAAVQQVATPDQKVQAKAINSAPSQQN